MIFSLYLHFTVYQNILYHIIYDIISYGSLLNDILANGRNSFSFFLVELLEAANPAAGGSRAEVGTEEKMQLPQRFGSCTGFVLKVMGKNPWKTIQF